MPNAGRNQNLKLALALHKLLIRGKWIRTCDVVRTLNVNSRQARRWLQAAEEVYGLEVIDEQSEVGQGWHYTWRLPT